MEPWMIWLALALLFAVVEMLTLDLIFAMLAGGALFAMGSSLLGGNVWVQVVAFALASLLLLVLLRPWGLKMIFRKGPLIPTGADAHIGRPAVVVSEVTTLEGRVKLMGEVWTARTEENTVLAVGTAVTVVRIDGATAIVTQTANLPNGEAATN
ncbi:MAG TPA: NfeD family protein [Actinomycetales bacterium]|nr:NfeD family protein [Actinomycetales bacterium]